MKFKVEREWVELKPSMYYDLEGRYWLARNDGTIGVGEYEWQQGRYPDQFVIDGRYNIPASSVTHIMKYDAPIHPSNLPKEWNYGNY